MRTILFTGKGGVGKTTLAAATALHAASLGYETLVMSTDIAHSLADAFQVELANEPTPVGPPRLLGAELDAGQEMERYWGEVKRRIAAVLREEGLEGTVAGELAIIPGLDEILSLVRIKRYYDQSDFEVLIIDSAPTGAAMRLLSAPDINRWYTRSILSKGLARMLLPVVQSVARLSVTEKGIQQRLTVLFDQVEELRQVFTDGTQTTVRLVLNPERMAIQETQRAYTYLSLFGLAVDALFINRVLPPEVSDPYFQNWKTDQAAYRREIRDLFAPLPVFEIPLMRQEVVGLDALQNLAATLYGEQDPTPPLSDQQPLRFYMEGNQYVLALRLTGVPGGAIDLTKRGDELRVRIGNFKRAIALPQYVAGLEPTWASIEGDHLKVVFEEAATT